MTDIKNNSCLICIDFINDIVSESGKLAGKGYFDFVEKNNTLENLHNIQQTFRSKNLDVLHVCVSFSESYIEHPINSPLFGKAKEFQALKANGWGTEISSLVTANENEKVITKRRVSAFYATDLEATLRARGIKTVYIAGVSTDLAVESAVRDAHDRDFEVVVLADCCAAANQQDHEKSLQTLAKIATVENM